MFIDALFTVANNWSKPNYPPTGWTDNKNLALKKNGITKISGKCMGLEWIILSKGI